MSTVGTVVVGGGLSGLVHAHALVRSGEDVVVLESGAVPGGVVRSLEQDGYLLELGPNTVRPTPALLALARELGIADEMRFSDPRLPRFVEIRGVLRKIPFGVLSPFALLRAAAEPLVRRGREIPDESAHDFMARRFGGAIAEKLLGPFVSGIYAGDARRLTAAEAFPKLVEMERAYGSVIGGFIRSRKKAPKVAEPKPKGLLSFRSGLGTFPRALAAALGSRFRPNAAVDRIERAGEGWRVTAADGDLSARAVVVASSASAAARIVSAAAPEAARALAAIPSPAVCVAHCAWPSDAFARPLRGFGHLLAPRAGEPVLGAVWSSALFAGRAPEGRVLLTFFLGGRRNPDAARLDDAAILAAVDADARRALGAKVSPELLRATRYGAAIPQYEAGHGARIEALAAAEAALPGLRFLGNYRGGISVGDVVENAIILQAAEK
ncbi:MAG TPA: protoporphyrinogen oxidase [Thermoanaerobaculia bacterium]|nr:protoporphyrinogen oxidase [Thermoanaerobaculia bacterium]